MADDERHDERSLELPSLRSAFRRRRRPRPERDESPLTAPAEPMVPEQTQVEQPPAESAESSPDDSTSPLLL